MWVYKKRDFSVYEKDWLNTHREKRLVTFRKVGARKTRTASLRAGLTRMAATGLSICRGALQEDVGRRTGRSRPAMGRDDHDQCISHFKIAPKRREPALRWKKSRRNSLVEGRRFKVTVGGWQKNRKQVQTEKSEVIPGILQKEN